MANLWAQEEWVNETKGYRCGDSGVYETCCETTGELYRAMMREYGRCQSKVYVDVNDKAQQIGWYFVKRAKYEDCNETYLQGTWVTVLKGAPVRSVHYDYADFGR